MPYPLRFTPIYFEKVWGGRRFSSVLGRTIPAGPIGESWEVSVHPHGHSIVANGADAGMTLGEVIAHDPEAILGRRVVAQSGAEFPLLVKYIDAEDALSVQVHPDDTYGKAHAGELGKTEMWYVLHAEPGSCLIAGLAPGVTRTQFQAALAGGDPGKLLHRIPVATGDSIFIPAGRIHAIMPGLTILEIQQNSDTTYRLYDWGRLGLDGQPRELHVEQALEVSNWTDYAPTLSGDAPVSIEGGSSSTLARCPYFVVEKLEINDEFTSATDGETFVTVTCVGGTGIVTWADGYERLNLGDSFLLPATLGNYSLLPDDDASFIISYVP